VRIGREGQTNTRASRAILAAFVAIQKSVGQKLHEPIYAFRILLLALATMLLNLGMVGQVVEPVQLGLSDFRRQRLAVDGDQTGDVALAGFDDVFGGVAMVIDFAQKIAERAVGSLGVQPILRCAADQGGRIDGGRLVGGHGGMRQWHQGEQNLEEEDRASDHRVMGLVLPGW
jgi:hypothetical protein